MKVKCMDNLTCALTMRKIYDVISEDNHYYEIINDLNITQEYSKERFEKVTGDKNNLRLFDLSHIKPFNYKDLNGKTLKMTVFDNEECLLVAGIDKETNTIYMLHSEIKR